MDTFEDSADVRIISTGAGSLERNASAEGTTPLNEGNLSTAAEKCNRDGLESVQSNSLETSAPKQVQG